MTPRPKQPAPRIRPVTRWAVAYETSPGKFHIGGSLWYSRREARSVIKSVHDGRSKARAVRVRITPLPLPKTKAKKEAKP